LEIPDNILELKALVLQLMRQISELERRNSELERENSELKIRLNMNSQNSSKPPTTDGLKKKPAFPRGKNSKQGGQFDHNGKTLKMVESPDKVVVIRPETCQCGADISNQPFQILAKRQEFEIPIPKLDITEFQTVEVVCPCCGKKHKSEFPEGINAQAQYGIKAKAFVTLLNNEAKLSFEKTQTIFCDMYGYKINEGTINTANETCYKNLEVTENIIQENILNSPTAHSDESGIRVNGRLHWLHVTSTGLFTYLFVHKKRGKQAIESEKSILSRFFGWLVHDCWSSYFNLTHLKHAICGAHLLRELQGLLENNSKWAKEFKEFLLETYHTQIEIRKERQKEIEEKYDLILSQADIEEPQPIKTGKRGKLKSTKGRNLFIRLQKFKPAVLAFAFNEEVPFTNNQAERDVRPVKVKQKISGSFRTETGAEHYARIAGFISTVRKNGFNVFEELCNVFKGDSFLRTKTC